MLSIDSIGALTKKEAMEIIGQGPAVITFYLLEMSKALSEARRELERKDELISGLSASKKEREISTPSGAKPVYEKENTRRKGRKRPGRKAGHKGERRATPSQVDNEETLSLSNCPDCGTELEDVDERERFVEDIKKQKPEVTKIKIRRGYCKNCDKIVEPKVTAALPRCNIGINLVALTAWLHYGLGITISRILEVLNYHLQFQLSQGGLVQIWKRLRNILKPWYDAIVEEAKNSAFLHGDETGWRVDGLGYWLWCFTNNNLTCYMIDRSRGHPALYRFFGEVFKGVLITDFWRAYDKFCSFRQACFVHLFREIAKVALPAEAYF